MSRTITIPVWASLLFLLVSFGALQAANSGTENLYAPVFTTRPSFLDFNHCDTARYTFVAVSGNTGLPSIDIRYRLMSGPGTIDSLSGEWTYPPTWSHDSIGNFSLIVGAAEYGIATDGAQNCFVGLYIYDNIPSIQIEEFYGSAWEQMAWTSRRLHLYYPQYADCDTIRTFLGEVTPAFGGELDYGYYSGGSVVTCRPDTSDAGKTFQIKIGATGGADTAFTTLSVTVLPFETYKIRIATLVDQFPGMFADVPVYLEGHPSSMSTGGFNFLLAYDQQELYLQTVSTDSSGLYHECAWEYFTFRFGSIGNCGTGCPTGMIRVVGLAEVNNGDIHPTCAPTYVPAMSTELFRMRFQISNNRLLQCDTLPITFFWMDCGDNILSDYGQHELYGERQVWWPGPNGYTLGPNDSVQVTFPGANGIPAGACEDWLVPGGMTTQLQRVIDFYNGGIEMFCSESIDARGDINLNGISYEIADYELYKVILLMGTSVIAPVHLDATRQASDVNGDGISFDLADLVYEWRVIVGDTAPLLPPARTVVSDTAQFWAEEGMIHVQTPAELGAVLLVLEGELSLALADSNFLATSTYRNGQTSVLVAPSLTPISTIEHGIGSGPFLKVLPEARLLHVEAATFKGERITAALLTPTGIDEPNGNLPTRFALYQNYPNPFNGSTVIKFDLPRGAEVEFEVLNVLGQIVWRQFSHYAAGSQQIVWQGTNSLGQSVSSGVYYYRLRAGDYTETKKMVLLK